MAHIVKFEVDGLAGHEETYRCTLNRDVNMFFGVNGSGKTSLLRILNSAMEQDARLLVDVPVKRAQVAIYSQDYKGEFTYSFDKMREIGREERPQEPDEAYLFTFGGRVSPPSPIKWRLVRRTPRRKRRDPTGGWQHRYLPTTRLHELPSETSPSELQTAGPSATGLDARFEIALRSYWARFFGEIQAKVRNLQQHALVDIMNEVLATSHRSSNKHDIVDWETAYDEMVSFMKRQNPRAKASSKTAFRNRYHESPLLRKVIARIDRVEREIETAMGPRTKLQNLIGRLYSADKTVTFGETSIDVVTRHKTPIGVRALSSGEKHILYILLECLRVGYSTIIIDEPEISMHVDWQKELIPAMRELNPEAQIIVATHSPEILAGADDSKIFRI
jgi:predicted ATPase